MTVQTEATKAQTVPAWAQILIDYSNARSKAPLDFQGNKVPKRIQALLAAGQVQTLEQMQEEVFRINDANGWFEAERSVGEDVALLHSEVSEMFEAYRDHGLEDATATAGMTPEQVEQFMATYDKPMVKPEGFGSECADVLIRLLDTCRRTGINLREEYQRKSAFNKTRSYKHGGKRI